MKAKKHLGQNFLQDKNILENIVAFAGTVKGEGVLEIGPGQGDLTEVLLSLGAQVTALEVDTDLFPLLQSRFQKTPGFTLVSENILDIDLEAVIPGEYSVVANIPYYITAPIIQKLITARHAPKTATLLVQKEVAERLSGDPKTRSVLTVATEYYAKVELGPVVEKKYFNPIPKVDSQVVKLTPYRTPESEDRAFFRVVKIGFAARRKTLFNNLVASRLLAKEEGSAVFRNLGWPENRRAQELSLSEWEKLFAALTKER
jgi:16S rRNA (adenine1518-N6/adenine1519-N6)-dimethyltransferase